LARSPLTVTRFRAAFILCCLVWAILQVWLIIHFNYDVRLAVIDSLVSNSLLVAGCWLITNILKYYLPRKERYWYILLISLMISTLIVFISQWTLNWAARDQPGYQLFISSSWPVRFVIAFLLIECMTILGILWYTVEEEKENQERKTDTERLAREAELYNLRHQLQPHFLFNSLNSISALVGSQPEKAREMIQQLSDFLRGTLRKEENQRVSLLEELQNLGLYLEIEKLRFGHRLSTRIEREEACNPMKLPSLLLQPIVENAIKFALYHTTEAVTILIEATVKEGMLQILVQNPYDPETFQPKRGTGFGLSSIQRRLYLLFARTDLLETKAGENLFTTIVRIPQTQ
jgi:two-component system LytT family sensor kinase